MSTITANHRQRLEAIRERSRTARGARNRARQTLDAAREAGDQDAQAVAMLQLDAASTELETSEALLSTMLSQIAGVDTNGFSGTGVFDDPQLVETLQRMGNSTMPIGRIDLGPLSSREQLVKAIEAGSWVPGRYGAAGDVSVPDSSRVGTYYGVVPQLRRPLRLLDLITTQTMDGRSFGYMREEGTFDGPAEVAEGAVKPTIDFTLTEAECVAVTIASWTKLKRQQLDDVPALGTTVNQRLTYSVLRRLENQILVGDGVGENILGILATPGIGDVAFAAGTPLTDLSLDGITEVIQAEATPNAVILNPVDLAAMLKEKAAGSGIRLDSDGAFGTPPTTMWGLPALTSTVMAQGQALVGDWSTGASLFIREAINVRFSDADQDDFTRNRVTALGEMRAGLAVWSGASFCLVHFAATAP
jgi:hypothetical protein